MSVPLLHMCSSGKWEVSLSDVRLNKSLRTKAQLHFQRGQYLIGGRDESPLTHSFPSQKGYLSLSLSQNFGGFLFFLHLCFRFIFFVFFGTLI